MPGEWHTPYYDGYHTSNLALYPSTPTLPKTGLYSLGMLWSIDSRFRAPNDSAFVDVICTSAGKELLITASDRLRLYDSSGNIIWASAPVMALGEIIYVDQCKSGQNGKYIIVANEKGGYTIFNAVNGNITLRYKLFGEIQSGYWVHDYDGDGLVELYVNYASPDGNDKFYIDEVAEPSPGTYAVNTYEYPLPSPSNCHFPALVTGNGWLEFLKICAPNQLHRIRVTTSIASATYLSQTFSQPIQSFDPYPLQADADPEYELISIMPGVIPRIYGLDYNTTTNQWALYSHTLNDPPHLHNVQPFLHKLTVADVIGSTPGDEIILAFHGPNSSNIYIYTRQSIFSSSPSTYTHAIYNHSLYGVVPGNAFNPPLPHDALLACDYASVCSVFYYNSGSWASFAYTGFSLPFSKRESNYILNIPSGLKKPALPTFKSGGNTLLYVRQGAHQGSFIYFSTTSPNIVSSSIITIDYDLINYNENAAQNYTLLFWSKDQVYGYNGTIASGFSPSFSAHLPNGVRLGDILSLKQNNQKMYLIAGNVTYDISGASLITAPLAVVTHPVSLQFGAVGDPDQNGVVEIIYAKRHAPGKATAHRHQIGYHTSLTPSVLITVSGTPYVFGVGNIISSTQEQILVGYINSSGPLTADYNPYIIDITNNSLKTITGAELLFPNRGVLYDINQDGYADWLTYGTFRVSPSGDIKRGPILFSGNANGLSYQSSVNNQLGWSLFNTPYNPLNNRYFLRQGKELFAYQINTNTLQITPIITYYDEQAIGSDTYLANLYYSPLVPSSAHSRHLELLYPSVSGFYARQITPSVVVSYGLGYGVEIYDGGCQYAKPYVPLAVRYSHAHALMQVPGCREMLNFSPAAKIVAFGNNYGSVANQYTYLAVAGENGIFYLLRFATPAGLPSSTAHLPEVVASYPFFHAIEDFAVVNLDQDNYPEFIVTTAGGKVHALKLYGGYNPMPPVQDVLDGWYQTDIDTQANRTCYRGQWYEPIRLLNTSTAPLKYLVTLRDKYGANFMIGGQAHVVPHQPGQPRYKVELCAGVHLADQLSNGNRYFLEVVAVYDNGHAAAPKFSNGVNINDTYDIGGSFIRAYPNDIHYGQPITWEVVIDNSGATPFNYPAMIRLPNYDIVYASASQGIYTATLNTTADAYDVTWDVSPGIPPGAQATLTVVMRSPALGHQFAVAEGILDIIIEEANGNVALMRSTDDVNVYPTALINSVKSVTPTVVNTNDVVTYTIYLSNTSEITYSVGFTEQLPIGAAAPIVVAPSPITYQYLAGPHVILFSYPNMPPKSQAFITVAAQITATGSLNNCIALFDSSAGAYHRCATLFAHSGLDALDVNFYADRPYYSVGQHQIAYLTATLRNTGQALSGLSVVVPLPPGVAWSSYQSPLTLWGSSLSANLNLPAGGGVTLTFQISLPHTYTTVHPTLILMRPNVDPITRNLALPLVGNANLVWGAYQTDMPIYPPERGYAVFTQTIYNQGNLTATHAYLTFTLPTTLTVQGVSIAADYPIIAVSHNAQAAYVQAHIPPRLALTATITATWPNTIQIPSPVSYPSSASVSFSDDTGQVGHLNRSNSFVIGPYRNVIGHKEVVIHNHHAVVTFTIQNVSNHPVYSISLHTPIPPVAIDATLSYSPVHEIERQAHTLVWLAHMQPNETRIITLAFDIYPSIYHLYHAARLYTNEHHYQELNTYHVLYIPQGHAALQIQAYRVSPTSTAPAAGYPFNLYDLANLEFTDPDGRITKIVGPISNSKLLVVYPHLNYDRSIAVPNFKVVELFPDQTSAAEFTLMDVLTDHLLLYGSTFLDHNGDGFFNIINDSLLSNVDIFYGGAPATTSLSGHYSFYITRPLPASIVISASPPSLHLPSTPNPSVVSTSADAYMVDFGFAPCPNSFVCSPIPVGHFRIWGYAYLDGNGAYNLPEGLFVAGQDSPLAGVPVTLTYDSAVYTVTTGPDGIYVLDIPTGAAAIATLDAPSVVHTYTTLSFAPVQVAARDHLAIRYDFAYHPSPCAAGEIVVTGAVYSDSATLTQFVLGVDQPLRTAAVVHLNAAPVVSTNLFYMLCASPGANQIAVPNPPGYIETTPITVNLNVPAAGVLSGINFGKVISLTDLPPPPPGNFNKIYPPDNAFWGRKVVTVTFSPAPQAVHRYLLCHTYGCQSDVGAIRNISANIPITWQMYACYDALCRYRYGADSDTPWHLNVIDPLSVISITSSLSSQHVKFNRPAWGALTTTLPPTLMHYYVDGVLAFDFAGFSSVYPQFTGETAFTQVPPSLSLSVSSVVSPPGVITTSTGAKLWPGSYPVDLRCTLTSDWSTLSLSLNRLWAHPWTSFLPAITRQTCIIPSPDPYEIGDGIQPIFLALDTPFTATLRRPITYVDDVDVFYFNVLSETALLHAPGRPFTYVIQIASTIKFSVEIKSDNYMSEFSSDGLLRIDLVLDPLRHDLRRFNLWTLKIKPYHYDVLNLNRICLINGTYTIRRALFVEPVSPSFNVGALDAHTDERKNFVVISP